MPSSPSSRTDILQMCENPGHSLSFRRRRSHPASRGGDVAAAAFMSDPNRDAATFCALVSVAVEGLSLDSRCNIGQLLFAPAAVLLSARFVPRTAVRFSNTCCRERASGPMQWAVPCSLPFPFLSSLNERASRPTLVRRCDLYIALYDYLPDFIQLTSLRVYPEVHLTWHDITAGSQVQFLSCHPRHFLSITRELCY